MAHHRVHTSHVFSLSIARYLAIGILGGFAIDFAVIYFIAPLVLHDPAPPLAQFAVWQVFWITIGFALLMLSRAKKQTAGALNVSLERFIGFGIIGGLLVDVFVIYVASPLVWSEPAPTVQQFVIWEISWNLIGLSLLYLSRLKK